MYYRLNKNSFVRTVGAKGYIYSQLTKHDLVFDEIGAIFLDSLGRQACTIDEMMEKSCHRLYTHQLMKSVRIFRKCWRCSRSSST